MTFKNIKKTLREVLSEPGNGLDGALSWGRIAASVSLLSSIVWVTRIVLQTHVLPDLAGVSAFSVAPYVVTKAGAAVQSFSANPVSAVVPPTLPEK